MYPISKPSECFDLSTTPLDELVDTAIAIHDHQKNGHIWFGYVDGWMLQPREEVLLRKVIRKFDCSLVSHFPLAFSQSWKNELISLYTKEPHGATEVDNNGSSLHDGSKIGYGHTCPKTPTDGQDHQDRKTRSSKARRVKERLGSA